MQSTYYLRGSDQLSCLVYCPSPFMWQFKLIAVQTDLPDSKASFVFRYADLYINVQSLVRRGNCIKGFAMKCFPSYITLPPASILHNDGDAYLPFAYRVRTMPPYVCERVSRLTNRRTTASKAIFYIIDPMRRQWLAQSSKRKPAYRSYTHKLGSVLLILLSLATAVASALDRATPSLTTWPPPNRSAHQLHTWVAYLFQILILKTKDGWCFGLKKGNESQQMQKFYTQQTFNFERNAHIQQYRSFGRVKLRGFVSVRFLQHLIGQSDS